MADPTKKASSSNYYRILGTNSNASDELIKQRYLEKVRAFPPEQDPEEFKRIRKAYDTLKDPFKRSEYDLKTKYQGKPDRLLADGLGYMEIGFYSEAEIALEEARELAADNLYILKVRAQLALLQEDLTVFYQMFDRVEEIVPESKQKLVLLNKAAMLIEDERYRLALKVVKRLETLFPDQRHEWIDLYLIIYDGQGNFTHIWGVLSDWLKTVDDDNDDYVRIFISGVSLICKYEKWNKVDSFIDYTASFIDYVRENEEVKQLLLTNLEEEFEEAQEYGVVRVQEIYLDIMLLLTDDPQLKVKKQRLALVAKIEREIDQMAVDDRISPFIFYRAARLFYRWAYPGENPEDYVDFPSNLEINEFKGEHAENLSAINVLESKYPSSYQRFKKEWAKIKKNSYNSLNDRQLSLFTSRLKTGQETEYNQLASGQIVKKKEVGRNDPCPCGSGKKYKKCCLQN